MTSPSSFAMGILRAGKSVLLPLIFLLGIAPCYAQVNTSLTGTVSDPTGAAIPEATVTATNVHTGISTKVATDVTGAYNFPVLPPGVYRITVEKSGFKSKTLTDIELLVAQKANLDAQLEVGQLATSVEVKGEIPLVQTSTASVSTVIGTMQTTELPLNLRRFGALALLIPGTVTNLDRQGQVFTPFASGSAYSANGNRTSGNNIYMDGVMNRALSGANFSVQPPPDAVQEFRIETNAYNGAYGLASGSVINLVTKSGTNELHGTVYEFMRNQVLDARAFFAQNLRDSTTGQEIPGSARGKFIRNQFGFAIGGPIKKNKTFFFGNLEPLRQIKGSQALATIPTPAQKRGDLSSSLTGATANLCGAGGPANLNFDTGQLFDPGTISTFTCPAGSGLAGKSILIGTPVPGNIIANINPVAQKALSALWNVDPNRPGFPNYISNRPNSLRDYIWDVRVDHNFSPKDTMFVRYLFGQTRSQSFGALPTAGSVGYFRGQSAVLTWTHSYSGSLLHEARVGFQRDFQVNSCLGCPRPPGTIASFGIQGHVGVGAELDKFPQFNFAASEAFRGVPGALFSTAGDGAYSPQWNPDMVEAYQYQLTWTHGKHTTQLGADMSFWQSLRTQTAFAPGGLLFFDGRFASLAGESKGASQAPFADFLLGYPQSAQRTLRFEFMNQVGGGFWNYFIHDDYKVSPNLTLNLGLRYEYRRPAIDKHDAYMSFLEIGRLFAGPGNALLLTALSPTKNDALCTDPQFSYLTTADGRCLVATEAVRQKLGFTGRRQRAIIAPEHDLFAPRFGLSWRPTSSNKLVVHAGAGIFFDFAVLNNQHFGDNNPVFAPSQIYTTTFGAPPPRLPNGQPTKTETAFSGTIGIPRPDAQFVGAFVDPAYKTPKIQEWSFGIESQIWPDTAVEINYIGNHGYHLGTLYIFGNQPTPGIGPIQPRRPFPDVSGTLYTTSQANTNYHSLQAKVTKRMAHGFLLLGSYTWGKNLDDNEGDEMFTAGAGNFAPQDYNNMKANWGPAAADVKHRFIVSSIWRLPFGNGQRFMAGKGGVVEHLVGGWSASYIFTAQSGFPLTVVSARDFSNTGSGGPRPDRLCNGTGSRSITNFLDASCFSTDALNAAFVNGTPRFGNSGRGILRSNNFFNLDLGLLKDTSITERFKLQFRAEFYNALNRPQFSDPNTAFGNPLFGRILGTRADPRDVQFGLKLSF